MFRFSRVTLFEVLRADRVEELAKSLDFVLLLVRNVDSGLGEHLLSTQNRRAATHRKGDRIGRSALISVPSPRSSTA